MKLYYVLMEKFMDRGDYLTNSKQRKRRLIYMRRDRKRFGTDKCLICGKKMTSSLHHLFCNTCYKKKDDLYHIYKIKGVIPNGTRKINSNK